MSAAAAKRTSIDDTLMVLVVDDDMDARRIYTEYLRSKGWTVTSAADGRKALDKISDLKPDVVVLDLAMPRVDGWTVLKQLRESSWTRQIPIIVVSAVTDARDEAYYAGCDAFLTKPCPPEVLWLQILAMFRVAATLRRGPAPPMPT
jgi:two-component system cell cycle response regulator DivK